eukprot:TRINITY_DN9292_c0_g2_i4.p2 TRINITY_DN9292_c0_g2~~TRINITY_DN9292_c0_g2_i4.p2  ORF type:complete len:186 (+),score=11.73 TRINITY_DN9292_c0_g2_i4:686-1243(+)
MLTTGTLPAATHESTPLTRELHSHWCGYLRDDCICTHYTVSFSSLPSYAVLGVVMDNPSAEQTLFYQVNLGDTRDYTGCPHHANACDLSPLRWYANQNPFGATDTPQNYNATCLKMSSASPGAVGNAVDYRLDVLPKLLRALAQGPSGLVKMASEWLVSGCYIGLGMQGNVSQSLYVHHFDIQES